MFLLKIFGKGLEKFRVGRLNQVNNKEHN